MVPFFAILLENISNQAWFLRFLEGFPRKAQIQASKFIYNSSTYCCRSKNYRHLETLFELVAPVFIEIQEEAKWVGSSPSQSNSVIFCFQRYYLLENESVFNKACAPLFVNTHPNFVFVYRFEHHIDVSVS